MFKYSNLFITFFSLLLSFSASADKNDFRVFDLRKTLPLTEKEESYFDYYISMGEEHGVKPGSVLNIYRRVPLVDNYRVMNHEDMQIAVAQVKVIYVQKTMSIGRVIKRKRPDNMPVLEFEKVMVGDRADIADTVAVEAKPAIVQEVTQTLPVKKVETKEIAVAPVTEQQEPLQEAPLPIQENIIVNGAQE